ncbi:DUF2933 domain-containing protein [Sphaerotilus mobilis]|uniref:DUF2933 family protein n=1 Tax=Sphaerotilus mobilis TaxID=47994 RepID=A0A4Q7LDI4_9BURK|nr:DUF2933 domain-containing protein [Sphaerotilus mobilis]RZS47521.1 DUF2933 family protein [Sphaerotilus mobilis]
MNQNPTPPSRWRSPMGIFMLIAGAVGIYYLLTEHLTHVTQAIPYLFLLACPLMHLFGHHHGGHGGHGSHGEQSQSDAKPDKRE